jgi:hypothetical protein
LISHPLIILFTSIIFFALGSTYSFAAFSIFNFQLRTFNF